ncbi:unnamed protein product [Symbiodinium pilosum]|uniref:Uncharacterized protein n=1 Tax=Symbiodinium pilosum TaxID=2952 RepID=A0A812VR28_SYMPI|nr:unnamed protein product [Symbiodinium pilosum]
MEPQGTAAALQWSTWMRCWHCRTQSHIDGLSLGGVRPSCKKWRPSVELFRRSL